MKNRNVIDAELPSHLAPSFLQGPGSSVAFQWSSFWILFVFEEEKFWTVKYFLLVTWSSIQFLSNQNRPQNALSKLPVTFE